jgi:hypothetical protein
MRGEPESGNISVDIEGYARQQIRPTGVAEVPG